MARVWVVDATIFGDNTKGKAWDKTKFPSIKFLGSHKVADRSAPTTSVYGTFELIDTNLIFKLLINKNVENIVCVWCIGYTWRASKKSNGRDCSRKIYTVYAV